VVYREFMAISDLYEHKINKIIWITDMLTKEMTLVKRKTVLLKTL